MGYSFFAVLNFALKWFLDLNSFFQNFKFNFLKLILILIFNHNFNEFIFPSSY